MENVTLRISGMSCGHCVSHVQRALASLDGVTVDSVSIGEAHVHLDPARRTAADLTRAIEGAGYKVEDSAECGVRNAE